MLASRPGIVNDRVEYLTPLRSDLGDWTARLRQRAGRGVWLFSTG